MSNSRRFDVALSFPGECRDFVAQVAECLAEKFGQERILYDHFHDAEFARMDLDVYLPNLYQKDSTLIVIFLCSEYALKPWCQLEWRHIRQLITHRNAEQIMFFSFDGSDDVSEFCTMFGVGYIDITQRQLAPSKVAEKIQERLCINHGSTINQSNNQDTPHTRYLHTEADTSEKTKTFINNQSVIIKEEDKLVKFLKSQNTNYVFSFGRAYVGKTAMLASLLRNLRHENSSGSFKINTKEPYTDGAKLFSEFESCFASGAFPARTIINRVTSINGIFTPTNKHLPILNITFLEMSGEDLSRIEATERQTGSLLSHTNAYLKTNSPIAFILITPWHNAENDDQLFIDFITYIQHFTSIDNRTILLISKWDSNPQKNENINTFVQRTMPKTFAQLQKLKNTIVSEYSIGSVLSTEREEIIEHFYTKHPAKLWNQLYKLFSGKELEKKVPLSRLLKSLIPGVLTGK